MEQQCDSSALSTEANIYSALAKRKAFAYYSEQVYTNALTNRKEVPKPSELREARSPLHAEEKKKFEELKVKDEKRYILERHVFNLSSVKSVFESGDKVAAKYCGDYIGAKVTSV